MPHTKRSLGALPLVYPQPAFLVCTYDENGKPNVMTAAWGGICSSDPVSVSVSVRPGRWTHDALLTRKAFTVCIPSEDMMVATDYVGIASGRRYDKFAVAGFTAKRATSVDAPYIDECPVVLECTLSQHLTIGVHTMMIGQIRDVAVDERCFANDSAMPDIAKIAPLLFDTGSRAYYGVGKRLGDAFSAGKALLKGE